MCLGSLFSLTVSCVLLVGPWLFLLTVSSESPLSASGSSLPRPRKRSLGFPRPEIVFAATFYKGFYKGFGTLPFSMIFRSFILLAVSCVLLVSALILLTVSSGIVCFVSPIVLFIDSLVRFARPGAAFADSLVRIACRRLWELSPGTSKTVPGLPET